MYDNNYEIVVQCPHCGQKLEYNVSTVVDGAVDEYQKLAILNNKFFELNCGNCGKSMDMVYEFMYCDTEKNYMLYFVDEERADGANVAIQINQKFVEEQGGDSGTARIVYELNDLIEKINIFDNGLDDRVVELMKFFCVHHAINDLAQLNVYGAHYCFHDGNHCFKIEGENGIAIAQFPDGMYSEIEMNFAEELSACRTLIIDQDWAMSILDELEDE